MAPPPPQAPPTQMRIHVNQAGDVEFSVSLTAAVDASMVATMVAAVRAGILSPRPDPDPPAPEPASDPDPDPRPDRAPSPLVSAPPRKLSVRQLAAQLDASAAASSALAPRRASSTNHRYSTAAPPDPDPAEFDPVREFSSSPALWLTARTDAYLDALDGPSSRGIPADPPRPPHPSWRLLRSSSAREDDYNLPRTAPHKPVHPAAPASSSSHRLPPPHAKVPPTPDRPPSDVTSPRRRPGPEVVGGIAARPIRMLSLPAGAKYDDVNDMYFGDDPPSASTGARPSTAGEFEPRDMAIAAAERRASESGIPFQEPTSGNFRSLPDDDAISAKAHSETPADRVRARRDRAMKIAEQYAAEQYAAEQYVAGQYSTGQARSSGSGHVQGSSSELEEPQYREPELDEEQDKPAVPTSPYVRQSEPDEEGEDPEDAWDNVEYVLTESYRQDAKTSDPRANRAGAPRPHGRSAAWRLFSSIGSSLGKRRPDLLEEDVYQSTLAHGSSIHKVDHSGPVAPTKGAMRRNRGYTMFGRGNSKNGGPWLEFSSPLDLDRMIDEVAKVAKALGYQTARWPGEYKLRCVRRMNHRHEMHMVILLYAVRLPKGMISVVRLKRARSDKNRTEVWRYSQFYRELIDRLQRAGIEITSEV